jgi:hypothetical protein
VKEKSTWYLYHIFILLNRPFPAIFVKNHFLFRQIMVEDCPVFYNIRDGPYYPALRILHQVAHAVCLQPSNPLASKFSLLHHVILYNPPLFRPR